MTLEIPRNLTQAKVNNVSLTFEDFIASGIALQEENQKQMLALYDNVITEVKTPKIREK